MRRTYSEEIGRLEMVLNEDQSITRKEVYEAMQNMRDEIMLKLASYQEMLKQLRSDMRLQLKKGLQIIRDGMVDMGSQIKGIKMKVEGIEMKVEGIEMKVEGIEMKVEGIEMKVEGIEKKVEGIEKKVEGIEAKIEGLNPHQSSSQFTFRQLPENSLLCPHHDLQIVGFCFTCLSLSCQKCKQRHKPRLLRAPFTGRASKTQLPPISPMHHDVRSLEESYQFMRKSLSKCKIKVQQALKMFTNLKQMINVQKSILHKTKQITKNKLKKGFQDIYIFFHQNKNLLEDQQALVKRLEEEKFAEMELLVLEHEEMYLQIMDQLTAEESLYHVFSQEIVEALHYKNEFTQKQNKIMIYQFYSSNYEKISKILENEQVKQIKLRIEDAKVKFQTNIQKFHPSNHIFDPILSTSKTLTKKSFLKTEEKKYIHQTNKMMNSIPRKILFRQRNWERSPNQIRKERSKGILAQLANLERSFRLKR